MNNKIIILNNKIIINKPFTMEQEDKIQPHKTYISTIGNTTEVPKTETTESIGAMIMEFRGQQVMIDRDLARLYGVTTSRLNEQVKRNIARFPESFRFQLNEFERDKVVAKCDNLHAIKYSPSLPYVFTEQGIAQLSSVLHSPKAIEVSVRIMNAFVAMRRFLMVNAAVFQRLEHIELHLSETDKRIDEVFQRIDKHLTPAQGIFFDGQVFDAHRFVSDLIRSAKQRVVLFDNYVDDTTLALLDKRAEGVKAVIYTKKVTSSLNTDMQKHDTQYPPIEVHEFAQAHDRFLCIDDTVYHIGASLKDLGKKWFAFSRMEISAEQLLSKIVDR